MKNWKELFGKKSFRYGVCGIAVLAIVGLVAYQNRTPELPEFTDSMTSEIIQQDTALGAAPKVETKTQTKTTKKKVTLAKASTKTYTKNLGTKTSNTTKKSQSATAKITVDTKTEVKTTEKYTKGKKVKEVTTQTKTTVTTTTQVLAPTPTPALSESNKQASNDGGSGKTNSVRTEAPLMDGKVINAFEELGFKIIVDPSFALGEGYFNARTRSITLVSSKTNHVYHELGHFLAFIAGNVDTSSSFKSIYQEEKNSFKGIYKDYASSSSSEFFAECLREYTLHKADLKNACPKAYAAVEAALAKITSNQLTSLKNTYGKIWAANA